MRVAFVIQDLFNQGAQASTAMMVRGFIDAGYDVDLIVSQVHCDYRREGRSGEFPVPASVNWIYLNHRKARNNVSQLRRYLKTTDAEAVIAMSPTYTKALRMAVIAMKCKPKLVHVEHGLASCDDKGRRIPPRSKYSPKSILGKWFWSRFHKILVVSTAAIDDFRSVYLWCPRSQFHVVHNPVISKDFFVRARGAARHPWLIEKDVTTFVSAGAYVENKGHMTIISAFEELKKRGVKARVVIFGRGELESRYREYVDGHSLGDMVSVAGFTDNILAEEQAADGYILSSVTESFGIALVEAMACGCPVIATDAPFGPREILKGGIYGRLVPVGDYKAMADAVAALCEGETITPPRDSWACYTIEAAVRKYEIGIGLTYE